MSQFTAQLVNTSGVSAAIQVGDKGTLLITVRNTITNDATMVSTIEYSTDNGQHWSTIKTFSTVDGDLLQFDSPAGLYRVRGVYTANTGAATANYALISREASTEKSRLVATLSVVQDADVGAGDHLKLDTERGSAGANIVLDGLTTYNKDRTLSRLGIINVRPGRTYLVECTFPFTTFTDATGNTIIAIGDSTATPPADDILVLGTPTLGLVGGQMLITEFVAVKDKLALVFISPSGLVSFGSNPVGAYVANPVVRVTER